MQLDREGCVYVLQLGATENRVSPELLDGITEALDVVEGQEGRVALVTIGEGAFYSNGYDLGWMRAQEVSAQRAFVARHQAVLARLLRSDVPTVAALNGHAVGGGALVALAHDVRMMCADRATFWLPEIDARIPFRPGMIALLRARLRPDVCRDLALCGQRLSPGGALDAQVVDAVASEEVLLAGAIERATSLANKDRRTYGRIKQGLYGDVVAALEA